MTVPPIATSSDQLTIVRASVHLVRLPLTEPFVIAYGTFPDVPTVIVKLTAADGTVGWGEATPDPIVTGEKVYGVADVLRRELIPAILGCDARNRETTLAELETRIGGNPSAKAAIDIALHDLLGRAWGVPVWALLGGRSKPHLTISRVVSIKEPNAMADDAVRHVRDGFATVKLKLGDATNPARDIARVEAVREAVGPDIGIKIDVNQGWKTPGVAIQTIRGILPLRPDYIEQPILAGDLEGLAEVRRQTGAIVMVDEGVHGPREMLSVAQLRAADLVNIKLMKTGGLLAATRLNAIAETAGIRAQVGTMVESSIASAAGLHLAMALGNVGTVEMGGPLMLAHDIGDVGSWYQRDRVIVHDEPGLGVSVDEAALDRFTESRWELDA